ncbi:MAG: Uma2 family endonuclease [Actinomycetota bacterium]|nr:Uma2 family endonuclease [Actinomycetota bacterium]
MTAVALPLGAPFTVEDVWGIAADGRRHELIEGALFVTPAPGAAHQTCTGWVWSLLVHAAGPDHLVLLAPFDWVAGPHSLFQPDVLVARRADIAVTGDKRLERTPLMVVEVASPSTRMLDSGTKRLAFEAAGVPTYWIVDPDVPSLTVFRLHDGTYEEEARVEGDDVYEGAEPFPVRVVPNQLRRGL